jgi:hypothetical protein
MQAAPAVPVQVVEPPPTTASIILTVLLFAFLAAAVISTLVIIRKQGIGVKVWLQDFPTHAATVVAGLVLALSTGVPVLARMSLGMTMPDGYGDWFLFVAALCGVAMAGFGVKRFSDDRYVEAKTRGKLAAAATMAAASAPTTLVQGDATITQEHAAVTAPAPAAAARAPRQGGEPLPRSINEIPGTGD